MIDDLETIYDGVFRTAYPNNVAEGIDAFLKTGGASGTLINALRANGTAVTPCVSSFAAEIESADQHPEQRLNYRYVVSVNSIDTTASIDSCFQSDWKARVTELKHAELDVAGLSLYERNSFLRTGKTELYPHKPELCEVEMSRPTAVDLVGR